MRPARTTCGSTSPTTARWSARPSGFAPTTTGPTQLCTSRRVRRSGPRRTSPSCGTTLRRGRPARANDAAEDRRALRGVLPATFARRTFARSMPRWVWQTSTGPGLGMHSSTVWLSGPLASEQRRNGATAPYQSSRRLCLPSNVDVLQGQEGAVPTWDARIPAKVRTQCGPELAHVEYRVETPALPQRWVRDERLNTGGSSPGRSTEPGDLRARPRRKTALGSPSCRESAAHARAPSALTRHRPPACRAPERPGEPTGHTDLSRPST